MELRLDPSWPFDRYRIYERDRLARSREEHAEAVARGLQADPKSTPHGGFRIACSWPDSVTRPAVGLSKALAELLPGTPAYPYDSVHSSLGNIRHPQGRLVDPDTYPRDRALLDELCEVATEAITKVASNQEGRETRFEPALLAQRMALVFARPGPWYWALHQAVHSAGAAAKAELVASWGPHLTLTRFTEPTSPERATQAANLLASWQPVDAAPIALLVGYYIVGNGTFQVCTYRSFAIG